MRLYLSNISPLNSFYTNGDGQTLYKVCTPSRIFGRTTTISRVLAKGLPMWTRHSDGYDDANLRNRFGHVANFEWRTFCSSRIRFCIDKGKTVKTRSFFKKRKLRWHGRDRSFVGPGGREYQWRLCPNPELWLKDEGETLVAWFYSGQSGASHTPYLEIFPSGACIVDLILVSLVYIEKLREDD